MSVDLLSLEVDDLITFADGRVVCIRGIIDQEDQRVLQLSDGSDLRVPKVISAQRSAESEEVPKEETTPQRAKRKRR